MNRITAYIRQSLQDIYPPEEVKALSMLICCDMLGVDALYIYMGKDIILSACKQRELENIIFRLQKNEPIQYIRGYAEFCGRNFRVAPGVLIPRPETAELVDLIVKENPDARRLLDIGTGSGCIAISLDKNLPDAKVDAWDISEEALAIARKNNEELDAQVTFRRQDVFSADGMQGGVRRVVGAFPKQLVNQFLFEAFVMNLIAFVIALGLIELLLPAFNQLVGRTITFSVWFTEYWGILVLLLFVAGIYISGYYPARALLRKKPIVLLKGKFQNSRAGENTRKILVIVQYTASMILLCGTLIVFAQLNYMRCQSLGVKTDQILVIKFPGPTEGMKTKMEAMRKAIRKLPLASKVTCSGAVPGEEVAMFLSNHRAHDALKQNRLYEMLSCDPDYIDAYGLEVVAGRGFSEEYGDDVNKLVINETAARMLGYMDNDDAIGEEIAVETVGEPMQVIGVVKDYHQQALNKGYTGVMLFHKDKIDWIPQRYISVVMKPGDPSELVSQIGEIWNNYFADSSFDYFFLDQFYDRQYRQDEAFGVLMGGFTGLAIFISCLGLWVLVMFSCAVRTKEMGIRKVLGASRWNLFYQLGKGFFIPIIIAVVIALPVAWFSMNAWLSHYPFRTELEVWFFLLPIVLMLLISFLTVAGQTMKVIYSKPARSLKYE